MTDEELVGEVLNGKTRIWRFTAEEQGGSSDTADRLLWLGILRAEYELAAALFGGVSGGQDSQTRGTPSPYRFLKVLQFRLLHLGSPARAQHGHRCRLRPCAFHRPVDHPQRSKWSTHTGRPLRHTPRGASRADFRLKGWRGVLGVSSKVTMPGSRLAPSAALDASDYGIMIYFSAVKAFIISSCRFRSAVCPCVVRGGSLVQDPLWAKPRSSKGKKCVSKQKGL